MPKGRYSCDSCGKTHILPKNEHCPNAPKVKLKATSTTDSSNINSQILAELRSLGVRITSMEEKITTSEMRLQAVSAWAQGQAVSNPAASSLPARQSEREGIVPPINTIQHTDIQQQVESHLKQLVKLKKEDLLSRWLMEDDEKMKLQEEIMHLHTKISDLETEVLRSRNEAIKHDRQRTEHQHLKKQQSDELKALKQDERVMKDRIITLDKELKVQKDLVADHQNKLQNMKATHEKSCKELETKLGGIAKKQTNTIDSLRKDANKLQIRSKQTSDELQKTEKSYNKRLRDLEEQAGYASQLVISENQLKRDVSSKCEQVESLTKILQNKEAEITRLSDSLSKERSTKESADESNIENISVSNRLKMLKSEFENICSNEWLDAKSDLDEMTELGEDEKIMFLCEIPLDLCADLSKDKQGTAWIGEVLENSQIQKYVTACSLLAWKMITQRPPMQFSSDGISETFEEKSQEPHFGSDDPLHKDSLVMYYVTPAMYHSDSLMVKGRVVTKIVP